MIIYFNGPSSVGKTTLARELQNALETPFLLVGLDQIIDMMPTKLNDWQFGSKVPGFSLKPIKDQAGATVYAVHDGPFAKKMLRAMKEIVVTLARTGYNILIDDVSFGKKEVDEWRLALKDFTVIWVGLTAPLEVLEEHEKGRGDRLPGTARWQMDRVHTGVVYDLMIDTAAQTLAQNVHIIKEYIKKNGFKDE